MNLSYYQLKIKQHKKASVQSFEVFVDDFIGATNQTDTPHLLSLSRCMLTAIHSVFPPPEKTGHPGGDPVSVKKIAKGEGTWSTSKEILGWIFDGKNYTLTLPEEKQHKLVKTLSLLIRRKNATRKEMEKILGKLQHASLSMPGGWGLFSTLQMCMAGQRATIPITPFLREAFRDWRTIIKQISTQPTHVWQLVAEFPDFLGYTDACGTAAGGVWCGVSEDIGFITWRVKFPITVRDAFTNNALSINDLELAIKITTTTLQLNR